MIPVAAALGKEVTFVGEGRLPQRPLGEYLELLPRNCTVKIDAATRTLSIERVNWQENSVRIDSQEGIALLDKWFALWTGLFRRLADITPNIEADLSGGMDSRISFLLMMKSGAITRLRRRLLNASDSS